MSRQTIPDYLYQFDEEDTTQNLENGSTDTLPEKFGKVSSNGYHEKVGNGRTNPFRNKPFENKEETKRIERQRSIQKYIREQQSIDDDFGENIFFLNFSYFSIINSMFPYLIVLPYRESTVRFSKKPILMRRTSSLNAACPQSEKASLSIENQVFRFSIIFIFMQGVVKRAGQCIQTQGSPRLSGHGTRMEIRESGV